MSSEIEVSFENSITEMQTCANVSMDVVVPSYGRPENLSRCVAGLLNQNILPDQIIVVARIGDAATIEKLTKLAQNSRLIKPAFVEEPGVIAAMNAGIRATTSEIVAFVDDDAVPRPDWLERLASYYVDPNVIGVGGKDLRPDEKEITEALKVGLVYWYGSAVGNHHAGVGEAREVHVLKGVNCSYRGQFVRETGFDKNLLGQGSQPHWEISLGASARMGGQKLIYDPQIVVDHYEANRAGEIGRVDFEDVKFSYEAYNYAYGITRSLGPSRFWNVVAYCAFVGTRRFPGLLSLPRAIATFGLSESFKRFRLNAVFSYRGAQKARSLKFGPQLPQEPQA